MTELTPDQNARLTPEEDSALRRLTYFERLGCKLSAPVAEVRTAFRARDTRAQVREPNDDFDLSISRDHGRSDSPAGKRPGRAGR